MKRNQTRRNQARRNQTRRNQPRSKQTRRNQTRRKNKRIAGATQPVSLSRITKDARNEAYVHGQKELKKIIEQKTQEILRLENELHTQTIIADQFEKEYIKCRSELGHLKQK